jgi:soluble lytic murein transglycosylase-like protein
MADSFDELWESTPAGERPDFDQLWGGESGIEAAASGVLSGTAGIGDLVDLFAGLQNPALARYQKLGMTPTLGGTMRSAFDYLSGRENSTKLGEDTLPHKIGEFVPGSMTGLGINSAVGQIAKALGLAGVSAVSGEAMRPVGEAIGGAFYGNKGAEIGAEGADILGSMIGPGILEAGGRVITPLVSDKARKALAFEKLLESAGDDGARALNTALDTGDTLALSGPKTYAEMAQTPSAARLQTVMNQGEGANEIAKALGLRASTQEDMLGKLKGVYLGENVTPAELGNAIRTSGLPLVADKERAVEKIWQQLPRDAQINVTGLDDAVLAARRTYETPLGLSSKANKLMNYLDDVIPKDEGARSAAALSVDDYLKLRSAAGEVKGAADANQAASESAIMAALRSNLDEKAAGIAAGPIKETARFKQTYDSGAVGDIFKKGEFGQFRLRESSIPAKVTTTEEGAKQFAKAFSNEPEMINLGRYALIDDLQKSAGGKTDGGRLLAKFEKKRGQFKALFGKDLGEVEAVLKDIDSVSEIGRRATAASKGQSATSLFTVARKLASTGPLELYEKLGSTTVGMFSTGAALSGSGLPAAMASYGTSLLAKKTADEIKQLMVKGIADPEFLKVLRSSATKTNQLKAYQALGAIAASEAAERSDGSDPELSAQDVSGGSRSAKQKQQTRQQEISSGRNSQSTQDKANQTYRDPFEAKLNQAILKAEAKTMPTDEANPADKKPSASERLIEAVIKQESADKDNPKGNPKAVSPKGARGLMQLMPDTAKEVAAEMGLEDYDLEDPDTNRAMGTYYLNKMLKQFGGDEELALAAYNAGPGRVRKWIAKYGPRWKDIEPEIRKRDPKHETLEYVSRIMDDFKQIEV